MEVSGGRGHRGAVAVKLGDDRSDHLLWDTDDVDDWFETRAAAAATTRARVGK